MWQANLGSWAFFLVFEQGIEITFLVIKSKSNISFSLSSSFLAFLDLFPSAYLFRGFGLYLFWSFRFISEKRWQQGHQEQPISSIESRWTSSLHIYRDQSKSNDFKDLLHELFWTLPMFLSFLSFSKDFFFSSSSFFCLRFLVFFIFLDFSFFLAFRQSSREHLRKVSWLLSMWENIIPWQHSENANPFRNRILWFIHSPLECILLPLGQQHLKGHLTRRTDPWS